MPNVSWDPVLSANKRNAAWVGGMLMALALVVPFGMAPHDPVLTPLFAWGLGVVPLALRQWRRPLYPFCHSDLGPTRTLSPAQARALTHLKAGLGQLVGLWVAGAVGILILSAVGIGRLMGKPYVLLVDYARWLTAKQVLISLLVSLLACGLLAIAVALAIMSVSAGCLLWRWPWIQAHCEPWPVGRRLRRDFWCVARSADLAAVQYTPEPGELLDEFSRPVTWRKGVATVCRFVGWPGLVASSAQVFDLLVDPAGHPHFPEGAAIRMMVVPAFFLGMLLTARYLGRHE